MDMIFWKIYVDDMKVVWIAEDKTPPKQCGPA
jgi:hypothetical protein